MTYVAYPKVYTIEDYEALVALAENADRRAEHALPLVKQGSVPQMPDLAIEIKSPDDRPREMREKADYYLRNGTDLVWLIYPDSKSVEVCTLDATHNLEIQTLTSDEKLGGGNVLPEFEVVVSRIFDVA